MSLVLQRMYNRKYMKGYNARPEVQIRRREWMKEYKKRPEVRKKYNEYMKEYSKRPEVKARKKIHIQKYKQKPKYKEYMKEYGKQYYKSNKDRILKYQKEYQRTRPRKKHLQCNKNNGLYTVVKRHPNYKIDNFCAGCKIAVPKESGLNCPNCGLRMRVVPRAKKEMFRY